jgi:predicted DCC family thiol-disulfide oxidoreductase YuxK
MNSLEKLTLFYDGACPLCQAEILFLSRRNQAGLLDFVDIHSECFDSAKIGISCNEALGAMYGQYASGVLIEGVAVFPEAYRRADLPLLAWIFSRKPLQAILQVAYRFFAKNRHTISRLLGPTALCLVKATSSKGTP